MADGGSQQEQMLLPVENVSSFVARPESVSGTAATPQGKRDRRWGTLSSAQTAASSSRGPTDAATAPLAQQDAPKDRHPDQIHRTGGISWGRPVSLMAPSTSSKWYDIARLHFEGRHPPTPGILEKNADLIFRFFF